MAIIKKPLVHQVESALQAFIQAAPDAPKPVKPAREPKASEDDGVQITLRLSREQLERLTRMAKRQGIARASYIKRAVFLQLEGDEAK
jgi:predicted DNA binding CopG/RHH family protein